MGAEPVSWSEILPAVQQGQESASAVLYRAFCDLVRPRVTQAVGVNYADDVIHDAYIRVLEMVRQGYVRQPAAMWAIMAQTARRQVIDRWRKGGRCVSLDSAARSAVKSEELTASGRPGVWQPWNEGSWGRVNHLHPERIFAARESLRIALGAMTESDREAVAAKLGPEDDTTTARRLGIHPASLRRRRTEGRRKALAALAA